MAKNFNLVTLETQKYRIYYIRLTLGDEKMEKNNAPPDYGYDQKSRILFLKIKKQKMTKGIDPHTVDKIPEILFVLTLGAKAGPRKLLLITVYWTTKGDNKSAISQSA